MRTFEAIEHYSSFLLGRCIGCLKVWQNSGSAPRLDATAGQDINWPVERPNSGGYNEAFVMHHWASFGPHGR